MIRAVEFKNVTKSLSSRFDQFSLKIDCLKLCNENIHVIVGPNGCGKTTLLNLIAGVDKQDKGSIFFNDGDSRRKKGFLMQRHYLFNMSVFENVALGLKIRKYGKDEIGLKVRKILAAFKIGHLSERNIKNLSGGERQRTAIAQILVLEPQVILMDEPTANIDAQNVFFIEELIKDIHKKYKPLIIITTHSFSQAYRMSSGIIFMAGGRIADTSAALKGNFAYENEKRIYGKF